MILDGKGQHALNNSFNKTRLFTPYWTYVAVFKQGQAGKLFMLTLDELDNYNILHMYVKGGGGAVYGLITLSN